MAISQDLPEPSITEFSLTIAYVTFHSNPPGDNELIVVVLKYNIPDYVNNMAADACLLASPGHQQP